MDKLRAIQYFVAAAEEHSLAGAARRLEVSVPSVHKLLNALEHDLGVMLFERTTRGLRLTANGDVYLESCQPLLAELSALENALKGSATRPSGTLVVGAHPQLAHHVLLPALPRFHAEAPEVRIDLRVIHRMSDPDAATVDVFVLHGWPEARDLVHKRFGLSRALIVATPEYWAAHPRPQHPAELSSHNCLCMRNPAGILIDLWEFQRGTEKAGVTVSGWLNSNNREVLLDLLLAGEGVGRINALTTCLPVAEGRLEPVLTDWEALGGPPLNVLFHPKQRHTLRVRLFVDFVAALAAEAEAAFSVDVEGRLPDRPHWHRHGHRRASSVLRTRG
jgi:DNA-binding transcriptional LysR family regulator